MHRQPAFSSLLTSISQSVAALRPLWMPGGGATRVIVKEFRAAGAVARQSAQRCHARSDAEVAALAWLIELDVIRVPEPGRYYLDEQTLAARNATGLLA